MGSLKNRLIVWVVAAFLAFPLLAMAQNGGGADQKLLKKRTKEQYKTLLKLTEEQQELFEKSRQAQKAFFQAQMTAGKAGARQGGKYPKAGINKMRGLRKAFSEELKAEKPDFSKVAATVKAHYDGDHAAAFVAMVDAMTDFHKSLTPKQREILAGMMKRPKGQMKKSHPGN